MSQKGLLTTVAYAFDMERPIYALEGSIAVAGNVVKWLRDRLGVIKEPSDIGPMAAKVKGRLHLLRC